MIFPANLALFRNVRRAGSLDLTFDLCFLARQLGIAQELPRKCPDTQFVLDHCGVPDIAGGIVESWRAAIRDLAGLPNVACKISGVLAYCSPENATVEAVRPWVEHCIESFWMGSPCLGKRLAGVQHPLISPCPEFKDLAADCRVGPLRMSRRSYFRKMLSVSMESK